MSPSVRLILSVFVSGVCRHAVYNYSSARCLLIVGLAVVVISCQQVHGGLEGRRSTFNLRMIIENKIYI